MHLQNRGYGGNQKTCYAGALKRGANIIVLLHPDYQYDSTRIPALIEPIEKGEADVRAAIEPAMQCTPCGLTPG